MNGFESTKFRGKEPNNYVLGSIRGIVSSNRC